MAAGNKRVLQLDVLRGIAILLVIGRHLELPRPDGLVGLLSQTWFRIGWLGVDLFFVLSGFLIGGLLLTEQAKYGKINVSRFLVRRGLKIYPAYIVFLAYLLLMPAVKALFLGGDAWAMLAERWSVYWPNLLFVQNYIVTPAGHMWTLAVEEHFYLILPFGLVALIAWKRMHWLVPVCLVIAPIFFLILRCVSVWTSDSFAVRMSATHLRLDALLFGVGIRGVAEYLPERFMAMRPWRLGLLVAGILLWLPNCFIDPNTPFIRTMGMTWTLLGAGAFLLAAYHTHAVDFRSSLPWVSPLASLLGFIGVYSYAIYLWHVTVIGILERELGHRIFALAGTSNSLAWFVCVFVISAGVIIAGMIVSRVVEWPVLQFRDRFFPSRSGSLALPSPNVHNSEEKKGRTALSYRLSLWGHERSALVITARKLKSLMQMTARW